MATKKPAPKPKPVVRGTPKKYVPPVAPVPGTSRPDLPPAQQQQLAKNQQALRDQQAALLQSSGRSGPGDGTGVGASNGSAYGLMKATLGSWGLSSLNGDLQNLITNGDTSTDDLALALSQTPEYKVRFAGNAARVKAGLPELTPAQYMATEEGYRNALSQYGIPAGFYDNKAATDGWIGGDVSPSEVQDRAQSAADLVYNSPPEAQTAWNQFYGGGQGGAIAAILDPTTADPLVKQRVAAAQIGGAAMQQGMSTTQSNAEEFAKDGVSLTQARQAYSNIAQRMPTDRSVAGRFDSSFGQNDEEQATLGGDAAALNKQQGLYAEESSLFSGKPGASAATSDAGDNY